VPAEYLPKLLTAILAVPALALMLIVVTPSKMARGLAIAFSAILVVLSALAWSSFSPIHIVGQHGYQFEQVEKWISAPVPISYHVGVDGLSLALVVLTSFVTLSEALLQLRHAPYSFAAWHFRLARSSPVLRFLRAGACADVFPDCDLGRCQA
jgi:NADH-quinone oxidoreductase subunit M